MSSSAQIDTGASLKQAWSRFKAHPGLWIGATLLWVSVNVMSSWLSQHSGVSGLALMLLNLLLPPLLGVGYLKLSIEAAEGRELALETMFSGWRQVISFLVVGLVYTFLTAVGFALFIVPGVIWSVQFIFVFHFVADRKMGPFKAMRASSILTRKHKAAVMKYSLITALVMLGGLLLVGVGALVTIPVATIAMSLFYRDLCRNHEAELAALR